MRVAFVQWPDCLIPDTNRWSVLANDVVAAKPYILVTNEMPFGPWLAASSNFDMERAKESIHLHEAGVQALRALNVPVVVSTLPVFAGSRLANEAFLLERGRYRFLHQKHFFPSEQGWFETMWFETSKSGFEIVESEGLCIAALICTELMFNEKARFYGKAGAHLIVAPRASGCSQEIWKTAGAMAAIVSGCYVVSSNRLGLSPDGPVFGGGSYAFAPDGSLLGETPEDASIAVFDLDLSLAKAQKNQYPVYVSEEQDP